VSSRADTVNVNDYSTNDWDRFTFNYQFTSGPDYSSVLGKPTYTDAVSTDTSNANIRRNKDVAFIPPNYGVFSGVFDTDPSNIYVAQPGKESAKNTTGPKDPSTYSGVASSGAGGVLASTSIMNSDGAVSGSSGGTQTQTAQAPPDYAGGSANVSVSHTDNNNSQLTQPLYFPDGSMGRLQIPKLGVDVKVWEGESLSNLKIGVGHFSFTSSWDGNVGIAGHNGGSAGYFESIKNLVPGDTIIYTTPYGTRNYAMDSITVISDTDYTTLGFESGNRLTLITCNRGKPSERLSLKATQVS
jgi:sortase A